MNNDQTGITDVDEIRLYAAMAYLFVLVIAPLARYKKDSFVNFHIRQGLLLSVGFVLAGIAVAWWSAGGSLLFVILLMADVVGMIMALQGRKWKVPIIGNWAEKISI